MTKNSGIPEFFKRFFRIQIRSLIVGTIKMFDSDWTLGDFLHPNFFKLMKSENILPPKEFAAKNIVEFTNFVERVRKLPEGQSEIENSKGSDEEYEPDQPVRVRQRRRSKTR